MGLGVAGAHGHLGRVLGPGPRVLHGATLHAMEEVPSARCDMHPRNSGPRRAGKWFG